MKAMHMTDTVTNIVVAGLGGQGVIKASDIAAEVFFRAGFDVKKSELHGMSQRGGSVNSDVRFGTKVWSPMIPDGQADYLVVFDETQVELNRPRLKAGGVCITPASIDVSKLENARSLNIALLGVLSRHFAVLDDVWLSIICESLAPKLHDANRSAFALGRAAR